MIKIILKIKILILIIIIITASLIITLNINSGSNKYINENDEMPFFLKSVNFTKDHSVWKISPNIIIVRRATFESDPSNYR